MTNNQQEKSFNNTPATGLGTSQDKLKIWWDEKKEVIRERIVGDLKEEDAKKSGEEIDRLAASLDKKGVKTIDLLVDATKLGIPSTKARDIFADNLKESEMNKIAVFGGGIIQKTIANFIFNYGGIKNARYFDTEEEALEWLKEK